MKLAAALTLLFALILGAWAINDHHDNSVMREWNHNFYQSTTHPAVMQNEEWMRQDDLIGFVVLGLMFAAIAMFFAGTGRKV